MQFEETGKRYKKHFRDPDSIFALIPAALVGWLVTVQESRK